MPQNRSVLPSISIAPSGKYKPSDSKDYSLIGTTMYQCLDSHLTHTLLDRWSIRDNLLLDTLLIGIKLDIQIKIFDPLKYRNALSCILASLAFCNSHNKILLWRRGKTNHLIYNFTIVNNCMEYLESINYIETKTGLNHPTARKASMAIVLPNGSYNLEKAQLEIRLAKGMPSIELKDNDKKLMALPTSRRGLVEVRDLSRPVDTYNSLWFKHGAYLDGKILPPFAHRVFNNGSFGLGGRFYCNGFQSLPKEQRKKIIIKGSATTEPDFSALHMHLLYAKKGIQLDYVKGVPLKDPYIVKGFERGTVKIVMLSLLNSNSKIDWCRNVTKSASYSVKADYQAWYNGYLKTKPKSLKGFIDGVPVGTNGKELLNAILEKHYKVADLIGSPDLGLKLQFTDSQIMAKIIELLAVVDIPCLPVHDSIRVAIDDEQTAIEAMRIAYNAVTGLNCSIA